MENEMYIAPTTYYTIQKLLACQECGNGLLKIQLKLEDDTLWGDGDYMVLSPQQVEYVDLVIKE